jgi:hypothetical protein
LKNDDGRKENIRAIPKKDMACQQVIAQLKQLLLLAEQGDIKNVFAICELRSEDPMFVQAGIHDPLKTLGLLDWAKARWRETQIVDYESDQV